MHSPKKCERNRQKKKLKYQRKCKIRIKKANCNKQNRGKCLINIISQTLNHYFPGLIDNIREIKDQRRKSDYDIAEIITACIAMFLFKEGSRNAFNNDRNEGEFRDNYKKIFKMRLPHMDTVERVMRVLEEHNGLEYLKTTMIKTLLQKKVLHKFRFLKKYFIVAIDGSSVTSYSERHCEHCLTKTSKSGKITYYHNVLEAKMVCSNGFSISIATEWIENPEGDYEKQDCEQKAFKRLAQTIKKMYPRLPICLVADGLYPNKPFFDICDANNWPYMCILKDGSLSSVWKQIDALQESNSNGKTTDNIVIGKENIGCDYEWLKELNYGGHKLSWLCCEEKKVHLESGKESHNRFTWLTNLDVNENNIRELVFGGRLRWKIENEGFNSQKNLGYNLKHKYSRTSWLAMKNYYQCLQIAHLINQLVELSSRCKKLIYGKVTIKHLWKCLIGFMTYGIVNSRKLTTLCNQRIQVRFG